MRRDASEAMANGVAQDLVEQDVECVGILVRQAMVGLELVDQLGGAANLRQLAVDHHAHHGRIIALAMTPSPRHPVRVQYKSEDHHVRDRRHHHNP